MLKRKHIVVLTGAGMSAESGLKTFRDSGGLWEGYDIEDVATPRAWKKNPQLVLEFYNYRRREVLKAVPNKAHIALADLEKEFEVTVITQNIDDLHERAGSSRVLHLHGQILQMRSESNERLVYPIETDIQLGDMAEDGAQLRPNIVWFEEPVPAIEQAAAITATADVFVVIGTSLAVYPAAGLIDYAHEDIPKYIIDKRVPDTHYLPYLTVIEKPATEGVADFVKMLENYGW